MVHTGKSSTLSDQLIAIDKPKNGPVQVEPEDDMRNKLCSIESRVFYMGESVEAMKASFGKEMDDVHSRINACDRQIRSIDRKVSSTSMSVKNLNSKVANLDETVKTIDDKVEKLGLEVSFLNGRLQGMETRMEDNRESIETKIDTSLDSFGKTVTLAVAPILDSMKVNTNQIIQHGKDIATLQKQDAVSTAVSSNNKGLAFKVGAGIFAIFMAFLGAMLGHVDFSPWHNKP